MKTLLFLYSISCLDNYIVMFKTRPNLSKFQAALNYENNVIRTTKYFSPQSELKEQFINGYSATIDDETVNRLKKDEDVAVIEKDSEVKIANYKVLDLLNYGPDKIMKSEDKIMKSEDKKSLVLQEWAPWGLSRILGKSYVNKRQFIYPENAGSDVEVFIIDTGINVRHSDFKGRARWGANFVTASPDKDENGHGTHVAGVVGGHKYGISKKSSLVAVKVLDSNGVGMISRILKGIDYVINEHEKKRDLLYDIASAKYLGERRTTNLEQNLEDFINESELQPKTVVNMSVGGMKSMALNFALDYAASLGIHFSVAAGNDQENACGYSPGSSKYAVTIGASDINDKTANFSNYGKCVDLYAPGVDILSAWNDRKWKVASGTSMACPHVAGVMALYLGFQGYTPENLKKRIIKDSKHVVTKDMTDQSIFKAMWPLNWFDQDEKLPLVSINKLINNIIEENEDQ